MLNPGTILDERYEIIDIVGTGGMSTVYRAKDHRLKRFVAVKVLKREYSNDMNFVTKFRAEAQSTAGLTHPNIVSVYDVCEDAGRYFIVMELVEGITLKEYINLNGRLSMDQAIDFSLQIASGLEAAHEHHVIHRDIKPQNIIVSKNGNLKVTDFGIAKAATSNTMSTAGMGSVHYISPEQARGGYSDERSDIYSLGITMYEMVTGRVPFEGESNVAIALMHIQNEITPPRELYPDIYSSLEKVILKATQKKPERRYLTAAALIADINRVKANPNIDIVVAPAGTPSGPTQRFTDQDLQKIKNGSSVKSAETGSEAKTGKSSEVTPDRTKIDEMLREAEKDDFEEEEVIEEPVKKPAAKKPPKKVDYDDYDEEDDEDDDDDDEEEVVYVPRRKKVREIADDYEDDEDGVDPKLEKAVIFGGIAAAVILAIVILAVIGNIMGWFRFGSNSENKTTTEVAVSTQGDSSKTDIAEATSTEAVKKISMIDVVGLSKNAAETQLKRSGFTNYIFEEENDSTVKKGYVIGQSVDKNEKIAADTPITIIISLGAEDVEVPDVLKYTDEQAQTILEEAGFKVSHAFEYSETVEKDGIVRTEPAAGVKAPAGSKVILVVSNGSEVVMVPVPKITGISESAARSSLEALGLNVGDVSYEYSSDVEEGLVMNQSIARDTEVEKGSTVNFTVSKGEEKNSYLCKVSGSVSYSGDAEYLAAGHSVSITVSLSDEAGETTTITTASGSISADASSVDVSGAVGGLKYSSGTVFCTIVDETGADVTGQFTSNLQSSFVIE